MTQLFTLHRGDSPLLINVPHAGTFIPPELRQSMTPIAQTVPDTDWHVHLLYEFALQASATLMAATHSRYVIDLNRDPQGALLYPGADNTELCPLTTFAREDIYLAGCHPDSEDIDARKSRYWAPYHTQLQTALQAIRARHGYVILLDGHSIRSRVPRLFAGRLPDLNLGTADGASCAADLQTAAAATLDSAAGFTSVTNGRFKGGYITRHYGQPARNVHALQLEVAQTAYMDESPPYAWDPPMARALIAALRRLVDVLLHY